MHFIICSCLHLWLSITQPDAKVIFASIAFHPPSPLLHINLFPSPLKELGVQTETGHLLHSWCWREAFCIYLGSVCCQLFMVALMSDIIVALSYLAVELELKRIFPWRDDLFFPCKPWNTAACCRYLHDAGINVLSDAPFPVHADENWFHIWVLRE